MENTYPSNYSLDNMLLARQFELQGKWYEARMFRLREGQMRDVAAIDMILEANAKGDEYRRLTAGVYEDYESRKINTAQMMEKLNEAHNKVYK